MAVPRRSSPPGRKFDKNNPVSISEQLFDSPLGRGVVRLCTHEFILTVDARSIVLGLRELNTD